MHNKAFFIARYFCRLDNYQEPLKRVIMRDSGLLDKECYLETQSGFMFVLKGNRDRAVLSVRRKVGTPPQSAVVLTPDELKRFANLASELIDDSLQGNAQQTESKYTGHANLGMPLGDLDMSGGNELNDELDTFIEREYPELANKRKKSAQGQTGASGLLSDLVNASTSQHLLKTGLLLLGILVVSFVGFNLFFGKKSDHGTVTIGNPVAGSDPNQQDQDLAQGPAQTQVEALARTFVADLLDFKKATYRQSQMRAMSMMTPELAQKYWRETKFPLSPAELARNPQDDVIQINSVKSERLEPATYQVDVIADHIKNKAGQADHSPIMLRLTVVQSSQGKWLIQDQKDVTSTLVQEQSNTNINTNADASTTSGATPSSTSTEPAVAPPIAAPATQISPAAQTTPAAQIAPAAPAAPVAKIAEPTQTAPNPGVASPALEQTRQTENRSAESILLNAGGSNGSAENAESAPPQAVP